MRILYLDIDTLRPDHLGCYGYHRRTSPNLDRIAAQGLRFENCHCTDAPCLPSRTALWSGRTGFHTGVINHGGTPADPFLEGPSRGFRSRWAHTNWMQCLRNAGLHTATISPFGERHSAWQWYASYNEIHNPGQCGNEDARDVTPLALDWIGRNAQRDNWFLHVNYWDPHTPYRAPAEFQKAFADAPIPAWLTEEVRQQHWNGVGPHSAREINGYEPDYPHLAKYPWQPRQASDMEQVRRMFDGYDAGILYADHHAGMVLNALADQKVLDETVIIVSSDHGECLGELNVYGDHQTADRITTRVPMILRWPGVTDVLAGQSDPGLHYQFDVAATIVELLGQGVPENWDATSFASSLGAAAGASALELDSRPYLVVSQGAWSCQRSVRFDDYLAMFSYHDGHHAFPDVMLYDIRTDPHEQHDLAGSRSDLVGRASELLAQWHMHMMRTASHPVDPMMTVLREGGPLHTRRQLPKYLQRLRDTGRAGWADVLARKHPTEC